ncbi:MAG: L-threonylcarbamoyladenylate synthase [Pseudomonadota bacterium]
MSQFFAIHPDNPQRRLVRTAVSIVRDGGVIVYPTDSCYALGCHIGDKGAMTRMARIRAIDKADNFTLVCRDLGDLATYARVDNATYRVLRAHTPGPYTFILRATAEVPRRLQHPKRKTIGLRVPKHNIVSALLEELGEPILSSTLRLPGEELPMTDPHDMRERLQHQVDLVIDGGPCGVDPTTVVSFESGRAELIRHGRGDPSTFVD